jgi:hypothetical protein
VQQTDLLENNYGTSILIEITNVAPQYGCLHETLVAKPVKAAFSLTYSLKSAIGFYFEPNASLLRESFLTFRMMLVFLMVSGCKTTSQPSSIAAQIFDCFRLLIQQTGQTVFKL